MRLGDRGVLKAGMWADVVVFDPETVTDQATFAAPHQLAEGMQWVLVNGVPVIADGKATRRAAGEGPPRSAGTRPERMRHPERSEGSRSPYRVRSGASLS